MTRPRLLVAALLVAAAVLFAVGTSIEAAERSEGSESSTEESGERILGIDATSPLAIGAGVVVSFGAAAAILLVRRRVVDLAVAGFAAVFGALDLAEAVPGLSGDEPAIGILALVIAGLHFAAAWFASRLDAPDPSPSAS